MGATVIVHDEGVAESHVRFSREGETVFVESLGAETIVNGSPIKERTRLRTGDRIQLGRALVYRFATLDALEEEYQRAVRAAITGRTGAPFSSAEVPANWAPESWRTKSSRQEVAYEDRALLENVVHKLRSLPPLVTSWEIEDLKQELAEAQDGHRFVLQGGDCAETLADCDPNIITNKLKILIQMSLVLTRGIQRPVVRIGRFAGQYAKPRSSAIEVRNGQELPSYFGDLVNRAEFTPEARKPDPQLLLAGYYHAAITLNFVRALSSGGLADLRRPEYFDLSYFDRAELPTDVRHDYRRLCKEVTDGLHFMRAVGDRHLDELMKVKFFTSHEGLSLLYESSQTRRVPRRSGYYDLTTHLPWIGERTRALDGAHVEFFRGIANPIAVKVGPSATPNEVLELCSALNPSNEPGKLVLVSRMGVKKVECLGPLIEAVRTENRRVLWLCDPMHGNATVTRAGIKTRDFEDILAEVEASIAIHTRCRSRLGGVHFEMTGEDVTECTGGGIGEADLTTNYSTVCDPRLNYRQSIQMAFCIARRMSDVVRPPSTIPPPPSYRR